MTLIRRSIAALATGDTIFAKVVADDSTYALASVMIDMTPPMMGNLSWTSLDVRSPITRLSHASVDLIGGAYDDESDVALTWDVTATDRGDVPMCTFKEVPKHISPSSWMASCDLGAIGASAFCIFLTATNVAGLSTSRSACLTMDTTAPELPAPPVLQLQGGNATAKRLVATWPEPLEPHDTLCSVAWTLCAQLAYDIACANETLAMPGVTNTSIALSLPLLRNHTGHVWFKARAINRAGLHSDWAESNCVSLGAAAVPPVGAVVLRAAVSPLSNLTDAVVHFDGWGLPVCGLMKLQWCVGTYPGLQDLLPCRNVSWLPGVATSYPLSDVVPELTTNLSTAVVTVTRWTNFDHFGWTATERVVSNMLEIDNADPVAGTVVDGLLLSGVGGISAWEAVAVVACIGGAHGCTVAPLLEITDAPLVRDRKVAPLQALTLLTANTALRDLSSSLPTDPSDSTGRVLVAASWTNFTDSQSDIQRYDLCYGTFVGGDDVLPCTDVGLVTAAVLSVSRRGAPTTFYATVHATDASNRATAATSAGLRVFVPPVPATGSWVVDTDNTVPDNATQIGCTHAHVAFSAWSVDASCTKVTYTWLLCDETGVNCAISDTIHATNPAVTPTLNSQQHAILLVPGVRYYSSISASACDAVSSRSLMSTGFVCDESAPKITTRAVTLEATANGASALDPDGTARLNWEFVFFDKESQLHAFEVCLARAGANATACASWTSTGGALSAVLQLSAMLPADVLVMGGQVEAHVRATNGAGLSSSATSNAVHVYVSPPGLGRLIVQGMSENVSCVLNGTSAVAVAWLPDEESFSPGIATYALSVIESTSEHALLAERLVNSSTNATDVSFAAADGVTVRFRLVVTNMAAMSSTFEMDCMVDSSAPSAGTIFVSSGHPLSTSLLHGVDAYGQKSDRDLFVCWHGFSDSETNIATYTLEMAPLKSWNVAPAGAASVDVCPHKCTANPVETCYNDLACLDPATDRLGGLGCNAGGIGQTCRFCGFGENPDCPGVRVTLSVEPLQAMLVANRSWATFSYLPAGASTATVICAEPSMPLQSAETYLVRVAAVNSAGDASAWARVTIVTDDSPPQFTAAPDYTPESAPMVHTGASSAVRQTSACCLRVSWPTAFDREVRVKHYKLCFQGNTGNATDDGLDDAQCVHAGNATRVLISSGVACPCESPDDKAWLPLSVKLPLTHELNRTLIRFEVHAENELGLSSTAPFEVTVDTTVPLAMPLQLTNATSGLLAILTTTCAAHGSTDVSFLSASSPLQVAWKTTFDSRLLDHWRVCLLTTGVPVCSDQVEQNASFGLLAAGLYTVQVYGVADTGATGLVSQLEVMVDATPPVLGCTTPYHPSPSQQPEPHLALI